MEQKTEGKSYVTLSLSNLLGEKSRNLTSTVAEGGEKERVPQDIQGARCEVGGSQGQQKLL